MKIYIAYFLYISGKDIEKGIINIMRKEMIYRGWAIVYLLT